MQVITRFLCTSMIIIVVTSSLLCIDNKRQDGLTLSPWSIGRCLVWDFTCPDTLAPSHIDLAVSGPGVVAYEAEDHKRLKYSNLAASYCFIGSCRDIGGTQS